MNRNTLPSVITKSGSLTESLIAKQTPPYPTYPKLEQEQTEQQIGAVSDRAAQQSQNRVRLEGIGLILISCVTIILMQVSVKNLSAHFSPFLVLGVRGSLLFLANTFFLHRGRIDYNLRDPSLYRFLLFRSALSCVVVTLYLGSLKYLPLGVLNTLFNTSPILTIFTQALILKKDTIHGFHIVATVLSFAGIVLVIQPEFLFGESPRVLQDVPHYLVVLFAALCSSFSIVFVKKLKGKCDQLVTLQYGYILQVFFNFTLYIFFHSGQEASIAYTLNLNVIQAFKLIGYSILMTVFAFCTQYLRVKTFYLTSPAMVLPFSYCTVLLGLGIDTIVYGAEYNWVMVLGIALTSVGLFSKLIVLKFFGKA